MVQYSDYKTSHSSAYISFLLLLYICFFSLFTIQVERALLTQKTTELDSSKSSTQMLQHELEMVHKQVKILEQQVRDLQTEAKRLSETISHLRDDKLKHEAELEDQRRRNSSLELASDLCVKWQVIYVSHASEEG
jgi:septal ring factor EnvC (AmiA/AmiB activator)